MGPRLGGCGTWLRADGTNLRRGTEWQRIKEGWGARLR